MCHTQFPSLFDYFVSTFLRFFFRLFFVTFFFIDLSLITFTAAQATVRCCFVSEDGHSGGDGSAYSLESNDD